MPKIQNITSHQILNSRGDWTIETVVSLDNGVEGVQAVPEGASKGENEAVCLPADKAVYVTSTVIRDALIGEDASEHEALDKVMIDMDGTPNKRHLGGNSILSVSLALAKAMAQTKKMELYQYLGYLYSGYPKTRRSLKFPTPVFNILNGGKHAHNDLSFQEFMIIPSRDKSYDKALEMGVKIYHRLKENLEKLHLDIAVGDEGGFAPSGLTADTALNLIRKASASLYKVGNEVFFGMDSAAESFYRNGRYFIGEEDIEFESEGLLEFYRGLLKKYELIYLEDPYCERDPQGWQRIYQEFSDKLMIVADDLVVTNITFLQKALDRKLANAVIVKPNQIGTLSETFKFVKMAKESGMKIVVSHRSGETGEDTFIADLALAVDAEFIKAGAPVRGERVVKYNRLLDIYNSK